MTAPARFAASASTCAAVPGGWAETALDSTVDGGKIVGPAKRGKRLEPALTHPEPEQEA